MRVFKAFMFILLSIEAALALSFWGGTVWIGGWQGGTILLSVALILIILPWMGNLEIEYNVLKCGSYFKIGWIGEIRTGSGPVTESRCRFLFFRWTMTPGRGKRQKEKRRRYRLPEFTASNLEPLSRFFLPALEAINEIIWESEEFTLKIQAPTQIRFADQGLEKLLGSRWIGPLYLTVAGEGEREILIRLRIGLLKGFLISLIAFLQTNPSKRLALTRR